MLDDCLSGALQAILSNQLHRVNGLLMPPNRQQFYELRRIRNVML